MKLGVWLFALAMVLGTKANAAATIYGNYYDETTYVSCDNNVGCRASFSQTPPDKLIEITNVACYGNTSKQLVLVMLGVAATAGGFGMQRQVPLQLPQPYVYNSLNIVFSLNHPVRFLVGPGRFPFIQFSAFDNVSVTGGTCHIVGNIMAPVQ
ncbi:hypothetical protein [Bradyrhizobium sp.]|uniref:hypothetical protein n=1 Tax=Bradyrhizobium sp. TaxID=376 RepID=UPI002DDC9656|nr:hypothetical protein [Bradyrhizobium sp.]HEV2156450.1 hypothetical protein [Bradyrhizobium sp.]